MSTGDNQERIPPPDHTAQSAEVQLASPYREISDEIILKLAGVAEKLTAVAPEPADYETTSTFNQQAVDEIAADVLGQENLPQALQMGGLFQELTSTMVRDHNGEEKTALHDGLITLVHSSLGRKLARKAHGSHVTKAGKLADYSNTTGTSTEEEQITAIYDEVIGPVLQTRNALFKTKPENASLGELTGLLQKAREVEPNANLGVLKLACFLTIADSLGQPNIHKAWNQIYLKDSKTDSPMGKIEASEFGMLYEASGILEDLRTEEGSARYKRLHLLKDVHASARLLPVASRAFKKEYGRLSKATVAYDNLVLTEKWLREIKERDEANEATRGKLVGKHATNLAFVTSEYIELGTKHIAKIRDGSVEASGGDAQTADYAWHNAIAAEELLATAAASLVEQFKGAKLKVSPGAKAKLLDAALPKFRDDLDQRQRAEAIRQLQPEIDRCVTEFRTIDESYNLSNKKLRERDPHLITLAHTLSESFNGHDSLDEAGLRTMVGLMLGVYWERMGEQSDPAKMARQYLQDASQLRALHSQLEKFGQNVDSKLLQSINLMDELIDSGAFDDTKEHPELEPLVNFVLHYLDIRDGIAEAKTIPETRSEESEPSDEALIELPTEIIGQAKPEDILVFPPGSSYRKITEEYTQHLEPEDEAIIHWDRIKKLVELRDHCKKQNLAVELIRTKQASWHRLPFFVLEVKLPGNEQGMAVVESPVYGNATYTFREADDRLSWRDAVELTRQEAREWGAVPAVHVDDTQLDKHKKKLWDRIISDLTAF